MATRTVPTACHYCYGACSMVARVEDDVLVKLEGNPESPLGFGGLCGKGASAIMLLYDPHRVNAPRMRTNPKKGLYEDPQWKEISWEEALDIVSERMRKIREDDPRKVLFVGTTTAGSSTIRGVTPLRLAYGSPNTWVAGGGLHCGNAAHFTAGLMHASWSLVPDFLHCNYAIYFGASKGHSAGHTAGALMRLAAEARARGMRLVVVDPYGNFAGSKADEWVPIRPGTDAALALAMLNLLLNEYGLYDARYLKEKTNGPYLIGPDGRYVRDPETGRPLIWDPVEGRARPFDDEGLQDFALLGQYVVNGVSCQPAFQLLKEHVKRYTPEYASQITTIPAATIRRLAREFGENARIGSTIVIEGKELPYRPVAAIYFRGPQGHKNGAHNCLALSFLNQVVGSADMVGGALGFCPSSHGHPETGRPRYQPYADEDGLMIAGTWLVPHKPYPPEEPRVPVNTIDLQELFPHAMTPAFPVAKDQEEWWQRAQLPYRLEMIFAVGASPLLSAGNPETAAEALKKVPFIVSHELYLNEFVNGFADIVLPDCCFLERLDPQPNWPAIFNHSPTLGEWVWPIRQPVVKPLAQRKDVHELVLELAERLNILPEVYTLLNFHNEIRGEHRLDPEGSYTWEEICDRILKSHFGPERGLEWFKEHGVVKWPKQVEEVYWRHFLDVRVPIYVEFLKATAEHLEELNREQGKTIIEPSMIEAYRPLPDWHPCPSHEVKDPQYDLWTIYYRDIIHTNSFTFENPWLDEAARTNRYSYNIAINAETARRKGIKDGDPIWVESVLGRKVKGRVWATECVHPEVLAIAGQAGHWADTMPVAKGKGVCYNELLELDMGHCDPISLSLDLCVKVKVYKAEE